MMSSRFIFHLCTVEEIKAGWFGTLAKRRLGRQQSEYHNLIFLSFGHPTDTSISPHA